MTERGMGKRAWLDAEGRHGERGRAGARKFEARISKSETGAGKKALLHAGRRLGRAGAGGGRRGPRGDRRARMRGAGTTG